MCEYLGKVGENDFVLLDFVRFCQFGLEMRGRSKMWPWWGRKSGWMGLAPDPSGATAIANFGLGERVAGTFGSLEIGIKN